MSPRRAALLAEMGLTPLWRRRARGQPPGAELDDAPPQPASASAPAQEMPQREAQVAALDWAGLKARVAACTDCKLRAGCSQTVFGVGDERARWLLVGEAPGAEEDRRGEPFVGQAGRLLDNMLAANGLRRGEGVYIANVVKCRPPGNRNPSKRRSRRRSYGA